MSGFSSLEKSPNSPSHKPRIHSAQAHLQQSQFLSQMPSYAIPYNNETKALFQRGDAAAAAAAAIAAASKADYMFSEENLNYIRELSKNVPICSAFENKSIFNVDHQSQMTHAQNFSYDQPTQPPPLSPINMTYYKVPDNISYDFQLSETDLTSIQNQRKNYPEVVSAHSSVLSEHFFSIIACQLNLSLKMIYLISQRGGRSVTGSTTSLATSAKSQSRDDEAAQQKQKHKNLTDRLVFYPSSNNIADYNSSMNLNYMGYGKDGPEAQQPQQSRQQYYVRQASPIEHRKHQQQQQQQQQQHGDHRADDMGDVRTYMRSSSVPSRSMYYAEYGASMEPAEAGNRYISNQSGYVSISSQPMQHYVQVPFPSQQQAADKKDGASMAGMSGNHKYLNKISQWMPDLKLKKMSKRYRSHSLPAVADSDDDTMLQQPPRGTKGMQAFQQDKRSYGKPQKDPNSKSTMFTSPIKSGRSFLQRKSLSLSTPLARDESNSSKKKKRSIASTMSNIMQKAKVYRRHSFTQLTNEYSGNEGGPVQMRQPAMQAAMQGGQSASSSSSKFMITKQPPQSYSQSDPESVYSDFFSDNEDRSASDTGDRFADKDISNVVNLFATMDQSAVHQRHDTNAKESDQGNKIKIFDL